MPIAFDLDKHVLHTAPLARGKRELALVRLATTPFDPGAPALAIPSGRQLPRRQRADPAHPPLLRRRHRAVRVMLSMTDVGAHGPPAMPFEPPRKAAPDPRRPLAQLMSRWLGARHGEAHRLDLRQKARRAVDRSVGRARQPGRAYRRSRRSR
jgi:hypothetical protein